MDICLSTAYLAPVSYYQLIASADKVYIEQWESYQKQSYRNRCSIATANEIMDLTIPVEKAGKNLIRDVRISEHDGWQQQHWRSIESAYRSTPFFEYYRDDFHPFYEKKWTFLLDFNLEIQSKVLELLDIEPILLQTEYYKPVLSEIEDWREKIHPKKDFDDQVLKPYYQVFSQKFGFQPNLSVIDLLFNMGNESILVLLDRSSE